MTDAPTPNDTREADLEDARATLLRLVREGLKAGNSRASFLAMAHRVLADEADRLAAERRSKAMPDVTGLPFAPEAAPQSTQKTTDGLAEVLATLPFRAPEADDGAA